MTHQDVRACPRVRAERLVVQELDGEVLVYDLDTHRSHCLNRTAALIWRKCNGRISASEISRRVAKELNAPLDEQAVWFALAQLARKNLLRGAFVYPAGLMQVSRRELIRRLGMAAVLVPLITSITAPTALASTSCTQSCNSVTDCTVSGCQGGCVSGGCTSG